MVCVAASSAATIKTPARTLASPGIMGTRQQTKLIPKERNSNNGKETNNTLGRHTHTDTPHTHLPLLAATSEALAFFCWHSVNSCFTSSRSTSSGTGTSAMLLTMMMLLLLLAGWLADWLMTVAGRRRLIGG